MSLLLARLVVAPAPLVGDASLSFIPSGSVRSGTVLGAATASLLLTPSATVFKRVSLGSSNASLSFSPVSGSLITVVNINSTTTNLSFIVAASISVKSYIWQSDGTDSSSWQEDNASGSVWIEDILSGGFWNEDSN
jgi:hypothetical protein